jgi:hypothetical protein
MLRAEQSLPPKGLSTLRFDAGRFPPTPAACYRASWQLPGPDSHRLADTSLCAVTSQGTPPHNQCPRCWAQETRASIDTSSTTRSGWHW